MFFPFFLPAAPLPLLEVHAAATKRNTTTLVVLRATYIRIYTVIYDEEMVMYDINIKETVILFL